MEDNFQETDILQTELDDDGIELTLATNDPIVLGRKSLIDIANLSITIAEDMSS